MKAESATVWTAHRMSLDRVRLQCYVDAMVVAAVCMGVATSRILVWADMHPLLRVPIFLLVGGGTSVLVWRCLFRSWPGQNGKK